MQSKGPQRPQTSKFLLKHKNRVNQKALWTVLFDLLPGTHAQDHRSLNLREG